MQTSIKISLAEYKTRTEKLLEHLTENHFTGVVLFDRDYILYYSGFAFIPTERPIAFVMNASGKKALFVPRLEIEHAQGNAVIDKVEYYPEYPFDQHPMEIFKKLLEDLGIQKSFAADHDGYPWIFGYRGPTLNDLTGGVTKKVNGFIEDQMMIKSEAEISLIRESVKWGNLAHMLLQRYTKVGATETEVSSRASRDANLTMLDAIGPIYRSQDGFSRGASAGYRGQIGRNSAIPHALANNITFQAGDVLITGAGAPVWGYKSELERTMIIGEATSDQRRMFEHMVALQETAFNALIPGETCASVDRAVRSYYNKHNLMPYWKHHVGHAIGIRYHESPFLDIGDSTIMQPGMVFTIEPGLYHSDLGGFRHSDTVVMSDNGIEILTYYPRDLDSLTIPI
jgi:Xaa-Pro aminopeptidase